MRVHNKIGSKERLFEMFKNVNKLETINEKKVEKKIIKEGYNKWGQKIKKSRINEAIVGNEMGESFDNPKAKDEKYLDKAHDNVQANKYDDGTRYPVEKSLKVADSSLEKMKGDDAPIIEVGVEDPINIEPEIDDAPPVDVPVEPEISGEEEIGAVDDIPLPGAGEEEEIEGGLADGAEPQEFDNQQIIKGMEVEMEHTNDPKVALEIAMDHLVEIPDYYDHLEDMEAQAQGADANPMDAVDAMGDGQEGEAAEEITGDDSNLEKEVLWGRVNGMSDEPDEIDDYKPKMGGLGEAIEDDFVTHGTYTVSNAGGYEIMLDDSGDAAKVRDAYGSDNPQTSDWLEIEYIPNEEGESEPVIDPNGYNIPLNMVMRVNQ